MPDVPPVPRARDPGRIRIQVGVALVAILLAGLALRLHGLGFMLPQQSEPDGVVFDAQVRILEEGDSAKAAQPLFAFYPHMVARLTTLLPRSLFAPEDPHTLDEHLAAARAHRMRIRLVVALLSLIAIPGTWWLARRFLPEPYPLVAAALQSASLLDLWFAQQARPHAAAASFALIAVCVAMDLVRNGGFMRYLACGAASALAIGALQNGAAVLPAMLAAVILCVRRDRWMALAGTLAGLAVIALGVRIFYPYLFLDADLVKNAEVVRDGGLFKISGHIVMLDLFNGGGFKTVLRSLAEYDPLLSVLALSGLAAGLVFVVRRTRLDRSKRAELVVVLAYVVPYFVAIGLYQRTYQRFAIPLLPYVALLGVFGLWSLARVVPARFVVALGVLAACTQTAWAARLSVLRGRPDTITECAQWIASHAEPETMRVDVMPGLDLPLLQTQAARNANQTLALDVAYPWYSYLWHLAPNAMRGPKYNLRFMPLGTQAQREHAHADAPAFARALEGRYSALIVHPSEWRPALWAVREGVRSCSDLCVRFSPDDPDEGESLPLVYQDDEYPYTTPWALRILSARALGPVVEIYAKR